MAKGGASAPLAPPLVAPLAREHYCIVILRYEWDCWSHKPFVCWHIL